MRSCHLHSFFERNQLGNAICQLPLGYQRKIFSRRLISLHDAPSSETSTTQLFRGLRFGSLRNIWIVRCVRAILSALKSQQIHWPGGFYESNSECLSLMRDAAECWPRQHYRDKCSILAVVGFNESLKHYQPEVGKPRVAQISVDHSQTNNRKRWPGIAASK
jgi:hypothetical protein